MGKDNVFQTVDVLTFFWIFYYSKIKKMKVADVVETK